VNIYIDFSVFTPGSAVGNVYGEFEFTAVPRLGELVSFEFPKNKAELVAIPGLSYQLKVEHVIHSPADSATQIQLSLSDFTLPTTQDAKIAIAYFEKGFGLHADIYEG
jgi:hypothetical protein